jgi:CRISPR-associated exonuclease Cas4
MHGVNQSPLTASDLRQFHYCRRVVFYRYVLPIEQKESYKMKRGRVAQDTIERLEARRKLKKYGLDKGTRRFRSHIFSKGWNMSGTPDLLIEAEGAAYPVDFKFSRGRPYKNHLYQLGAYALIMQDVSDRSVDKGFIYMIAQEDAVVYDLTSELQQECIQAIHEIRKMIEEEDFPEAPAQRGKCADCEFQNYCRDIW